MADAKPSDPSQKLVERAALRLLARREYSTEEMRRRLVQAGHPPAAVDAVIERLAAKHSLSDARFAGSLVRQRRGRGQGPKRIRAELKRQGITEELIQAEFANVECDWARLAIQLRVRKFGSEPPVSSAERAKQARFLQYRGFTADQIRAALGADADPAGSGMDADFRSDPEPDF